MPADPTDLCTIADVKVAMEMSGSDTSLDPRLQAAVTAVSGELMRRLERELVPQSTGVVRTFPVSVDAAHAVVNLSPFDLRTITTVKLHPEAGAGAIILSSSEYAGQPTQRPDGTYTRLQIADTSFFSSSFSLLFGYAQVEVTGDWGVWAVNTIPQWVKDEVALAVRARIRQSAASDVYSQNTDGGQVMTAPPPVYGLPRATLEAFAHMQRWMP